MSNKQKNQNREVIKQGNTKGNSFEIIGRKGNHFDIIRSDGKKTVMFVPTKQDDENDE